MNTIADEPPVVSQKMNIRSLNVFLELNLLANAGTNQPPRKLGLTVSLSEDTPDGTRFQPADGGTLVPACKWIVFPGGVLVPPVPPG